MKDRDLGAEQNSSSIELKVIHSNYEARVFADYLNDPTNLRHFSNPPKNGAEVFERMSTRGRRSFIAYDEADGVTIVGGLTITDAPPSRHDHYLEQVVVNPQMKGLGLGKKILEKALDFAATTLADDGRARIKVCAGIVVEIEEAERMVSLVKSLAFQLVGRFPNQVDVPILDDSGNILKDELGRQVNELKPVERYEVDLASWRNNRGLHTPKAGFRL